MEENEGADVLHKLRPRLVPSAAASAGADAAPVQEDEMDTVSRAGNAPVLVVLRAAAEIDGIPCRPDMSKEDIATAMLGKGALNAVL